MQVNKFLFSFIILITATKAGAQTSALAMADSLYAVGNYSGVIEQLETIEPKSEAVHSRLAKAWEARGIYPEALKNYSIVLQKNPERVLTAVAYGKLLTKTGKLTAADSIFQNLANKYPENAAFHYQLGLIKEKRKDSTAMVYFFRTIAFDITHQQALYKISKDFLAHRKYVQAESFSKKGLEENPSNASLVSILAQSYFRQEYYEGAINEFEKLVALGEGSEFVHTKLGAAYFQKKNMEKATEHYTAALDYEDQNAGTHHMLGKIYVLTGDYEKSEFHLLAAILLKDQLIDAEFLSLALTYKMAKDYKKALEYFEKALEENPMNERALYERATAADAYYEDLETRRNYYQAYLNKFEEKGNKHLISLAKRRVEDIEEELHLSR
jgi:tetratricopeptide (TPR) repeat protein